MKQVCVLSSLGGGLTRQQSWAGKSLPVDSLVSRGNQRTAAADSAGLGSAEETLL